MVDFKAEASNMLLSFKNRIILRHLITILFLSLFKIQNVRTELINIDTTCNAALVTARYTRLPRDQ